MDEDLERFRQDLRQQLLVWAWPRVVAMVEELGVALVIRGVWTMRSFQDVLESIERVRRWERELAARGAEERSTEDRGRS